MDETPSLLQIKGIRDGLLITFGDAPWLDLEAAFIKHIDDQPAFFQGARVALDVGQNSLRVAEMSKLRDQLSERGISLWAVQSESPITQTTAQNLGLATRIAKPRPSEAQNAGAADIPENAALWVQQTLRSGQRVEYEGHVVVMGDVNPGAEIVAGDRKSTRLNSSHRTSRR
jgi:septum site-determining protein MinC